MVSSEESRPVLHVEVTYVIFFELSKYCMYFDCLFSLDSLPHRPNQQWWGIVYIVGPDLQAVTCYF